jgi:hypothetical protein
VVSKEQKVRPSPHPLTLITLFIFFVQTMAAAASAKFIKFKPVGRVLFIFCRNVVALLTLGALQNYIISRHFPNSSF